VQRAVVVVNPISGSARRKRRVERFVAALEADGIATEVRPTRGPGDGAVRAREAVDNGAAIVVAAGGDGTVNDVAAGLLEAGSAGASLAVLPLGTANLVARHLGISLRSPEAAARGLATAEAVAIDVAEVHSEGGSGLMVACAGIGIDADVVSRLSKKRSGHIGQATYLRPLLQSLLHYPWAPFRAFVDDLPPLRGHALLVLNMRPYAAVMTPVPDASATDGLLDVVILHGSGVLRAARWGARALCGRLLHDGAATRLRASRLRVEAETEAAVPLEIDGDVGGETPVDMLVRPRALRILRPDVHDDRRQP